MGKHSDSCGRGCRDSHDYNDPSSYDWWGGVDRDEPSQSCFPYSALVETPFGKVPIGELTKGQDVLSYRGGGILVPRRITRVLKYDVSSIVRVEFTHDEAYLKCTKSHSFLTGRGWLSVKNLHTGDSIFRARSSQIQKAVIRSIIPTGIMEPVFNLYTEGEHNFLVDGYIAHNFTHFRLLRIAFHKLFIDDSPKVTVGTLLSQH